MITTDCNCFAGITYLTIIADWTIATAAGSDAKSLETLEMNPRGPGMQDSAWLCVFRDPVGGWGTGSLSGVNRWIFNFALRRVQGSLRQLTTVVNTSYQSAF